MILAFDSEVTGLDIRHGATPFFITTCDETGNQAYWEWDVDPRTREVKIPAGDVDDVRNLLYSADELVTQNGKFDVTALASIGIVDFPWYKLQDTLIAGHLLASNLAHDLTSMALQYLGIDIEPLEKAMEAACQSARRKARKHCKDFRIAKKGLAEMPSAKEKCWKADTWLPKIMAKVLKSDKYESWKTVTRDYANADSATTLAVWLAQRKQIEARGLWAIYRERMKALPIAYRMECHGVTISSTRLDELTKEYREESQRAERVCVHIAESMGYEISLPRGGNNKALVEFAFAEDGLSIPAVKRSKKTGNPSLDKSVLEVARLTLSPKSKAHKFAQLLLGKRKRDTAVSYMENYHRFWKPLKGNTYGESRVQERSGPTEVPAESQKDEDLLGLDGQQSEAGVRPVHGVRRVPSPQGELHSVRRADSTGHAGIAQVRSSVVRKPGPPVLGDEQRQLRGHGQKEEAGSRKSERVKAVPGTAATGRSALDKGKTGMPSEGGPERGQNSPGEEKKGGRTPLGDKPGFGGEGGRSRERETDGRVGSGDQEQIPTAKIVTRKIGQSLRRGTVHDKQYRTAQDLDASVKSPEWYVLHPSLSLTGTDTLRWSCQNPNTQNIGKGGIDGDVRSLRYCFGPAPGREWWSLDAKNIELRIPAYEAEEEDFIALFERPDEPPYFGSNHLLVSHILHEDLFNQCMGEDGQLDGRIFKKRYASTWYQRIKNGNFAVQYGAIDKDDGTGTADRAYGVPGAQARIKARFKKQEALNQKWIRFAEKYGYVETMPDLSVDPTKGYPLLCTRTEWGRILPTVPLNYHVQGTAMWWMHRAVVRVQAKLDEWNRREGKEEYKMVLQVHDELVFDFPKSLVHPKHNGGKGSNLWRVKVIQGLMEQGGLDIGVPTPTSCELHELTWAEGVSI